MTEFEILWQELAKTEERLRALEADPIAILRAKEKRLDERCRELLIKIASREATQGIRWMPGGQHKNDGLDMLVNERSAAAADLQRRLIDLDCGRAWLRKAFHRAR